MVILTLTLIRETEDQLISNSNTRKQRPMPPYSRLPMMVMEDGT
jgi:hypothetical protein